jgi:DHA1 family bicyclomycin/chloramphenicol resistance-like MFS transporter
MSSAPFFTVIGGAPHYVVTILGRSPAELGLWFVVASAGYMFGNFIAGRFSVQYGVNALVSAGLMVQAVGIAVIVALFAFAPQIGPAALFVPLAFVFIGNGATIPNAIAGAVSVRPEAAGTASGIVGFFQVGFGAVFVQTVPYTLAGASDAFPMSLLMLAEAVVGLLAYWLLVRPRQTPTR